MQDQNEEALFRLLLTQNIDIFTQAEAMHVLCAQFHYTQSGLAKRLGVSQSCIGNKTRLLQFSSSERSAICQYGLSERHARALLRAKPPKREKLITTAGSMRLTVQQTEELVEQYAYAKELTEFDNQSLTLDTFTEHTQASVQRLCSVGYHTSCMVESGENCRRITITIADGCFT